jgi:uncharacterized membrane protein YjjB (DUF3815 family)
MTPVTTIVTSPVLAMMVSPVVAMMVSPVVAVSIVIATSPHRRAWLMVVGVVLVVVIWGVKNDIDLSPDIEFASLCRSCVANEASSGYNQ